MKIINFACLFLCLTTTLLLSQSNPVPLINPPLVPTAVSPGESSFTLTISGTGFVAGAVASWNGIPVSTKFISASVLKATIPATYIENPLTANVGATNPAPAGGGASNSLPLFVTYPTSDISFFLGSCNIGPVFAAMDLNEDNKVDLVRFFQAPDSTVHLGMNLADGNGCFQSMLDAGRVADYLPYESLVAADFNGDGHLDLAVGTGSGVVVFLGKGDGTFQAPISSAFPDYFLVRAAGDLNSDGILDLVAVTAPGSTSTPFEIAVLLGNGDGTFRQAGIYSGFSFGGIGDFDGDGLLDVAAVAWQGNYSYSNFVIFHGNGDGTLQQGNTYNAIPLPQSHANYEMVGEFLSSAVDLNGDGKLDLLAEDCVLTGNGDGTFNRIPRARSNLRLLDSYMADFNGDGNPDVLVEADNNDNPPYFAVFYGNGDGTFSSENALDSKNADWMMIGDFNNDGRLDLNPSILQVGISPAAVLSSTSINFAAEPIGSISPSQKVTLTSSGNAPLTIQLIEATGDFGETNNCPLNTAIPVGYSCSVSVTFTPTQFGLRIGTVTFQDNAANSPQTVSLSGVGISPTTTLLGSSSNPSAFGQTVTFKASVTSQSSGTPTGTVTFTNGSTAMCNGVTLSEDAR